MSLVANKKSIGDRVVFQWPGWKSSWVDFDSNTTQKDSQNGQCLPQKCNTNKDKRGGLLYILEVGWCILEEWQRWVLGCNWD